MNIAIIGNGKMGSAVAEEARQRGHTIAAIVDNETDWQTQQPQLRTCHVAFEFTSAVAAPDNITRCLQLQLPVVVGTTGWYARVADMQELCRQTGGALLVASNFSLGMNIMFELNRRMAALLSRYPGYEVQLYETHHIHKRDAPSGTAISLARDIVEATPHLQDWYLASLNREGAREQFPPTEPIGEENLVPIHSIRRGEHPGTHRVVYNSAEDTIELQHTAHSRKGLALGAVLAGEFLQDKKGFYTMQDMLQHTES